MTIPSSIVGSLTPTTDSDEVSTICGSMASDCSIEMTAEQFAKASFNSLSFSETDSGWDTDVDDCESFIEVTEEEYSQTSAWELIRNQREDSAVAELFEIFQLNKGANHLSPETMEALVAILWESAGHQRTQVIGCQVLQQLALVVAPNRSRMLHAGAAFVLHFAMLHHPNSESIQESSLATLELLCQTSKHRFMIKRLSSWQSVIDLVIVALQLHPDHSGVQTRGMGLLLLLSKTDEDVLECILSKGGREVATQTWKKHQDFAPIATASWELIHRLVAAHSHAPPNEDIVLAATKLCISPQDKVLQAQGMDVLARLAMMDFQSTQWECTTTFEKELDHSSDLGVAGTSDDDLEGQVFAVMNQRNKRPYVQKTVSVISKRGDGHSTSICSAIADAKGIPAVVAAMSASIHDNTRLLMNACIVLASLAVNSQSQMIRKEGGLHSVVAAMSQHCDHAGVQKNGCVALANLWASETNLAMNEPMSTSEDEDGVDAVIAAMEGHPDESDIQLIGCRALLYFAIYQERQKLEKPNFLLSKIVGAILSSMQRCERDSNVQEVGCNALGSIAASSAGRTVIAEANGLGTLLQLLRTEAANFKVHLASSTALLNLSVCGLGCAKMVAAGAAKALLQLMDQHTSQPDFLEMAALVLHNLCLHSGSCGPSETLKKNVAKGLKNAMEQRRYSPRLQASCMDALWAVAVNGGSQNIVSSGCASLIIFALAKFKDISRVQTRGSMMLTTLAEGSSNISHSLAVALSKGSSSLMSSKSNNEAWLSYSWRLLSVLVNQSGISELMSEASVVALASGMRKNQQSPRLQFFGGSLLAASFPLNTELARKTTSDAIEAMVSAISSLNASVHDNAISKMLHHFETMSTSLSGDRQLDSSALVAPALLSVMNRRRPHRDIQHSALKLLLPVRLLDSSGAPVADFVPAITETMRFHNKETKLQALSCILLSRIAPKVSPRDTQLVADAILTTMDANPTNSVIQKYGRRSFDNLSLSVPPNVIQRFAKDGMELQQLHKFLWAALTTSLIADEVLGPFFLLWLIESYWGHFDF